MMDGNEELGNGETFNNNSVNGVKGEPNGKEEFLNNIT